MFEVYKWLYDSAKAFWMTEEPGGYVIGCIIYAFAIWYLMHVISIPFYLKEIAKNTRRGR